MRKRTTTYNEKRDYHSVLQKLGEFVSIDEPKESRKLVDKAFEISDQAHSCAFSPWLPVWGYPFSGAVLPMVCKQNKLLDISFQS